MAGDGIRFVMGVFRPSQGRYVVGPRVEAPFYSFATMQVAEHIEAEVERSNPGSQDRRFVARMRIELEDEEEVMTEIRPANAVVGVRGEVSGGLGMLRGGGGMMLRRRRGRRWRGLR
jgi:hypothetical protein